MKNKISVFIFTTEFEKTNSSIIKALLEASNINVIGVYVSKRHAKGFPLKKRLKRYGYFGYFNLIRIAKQFLIKFIKNRIYSDNSNIDNLKKSNIKKFTEFNYALNSKEALNADVTLLIHFNRIIPKKYIKLYKTPLNIHLGKLPYYRGVNPLFWTMLNNEEQITVTVHIAEEGIDTGDIVFEKSFQPLSDVFNENRYYLSSELSKHITSIIINVVTSKANYKKQDNKKAEYFKRPDKRSIKKFLDKGYNFY